MNDKDGAHARLREAGLRLTPQRRAVIDAIAGDTSHPTADDIASRLATVMPGTSLSTVYKVLHELAQLDLVRPLETPGPTRFDPEVGDHVHVLCERCGRIADAPLPAAAASAIADSVAREGLIAERIDVVVRGSCDACSKPV